MEDIKIEFTPEDISNVLFEWYKLSQNDETVKEQFIKRYLGHELTSMIEEINYLTTFYHKESKTLVDSDNVKEIAKNIVNKAKEIHDSYMFIKEEITDNNNLNKEFFHKFGKEHYEKFISFFKQFSQFPLFEQLTKLNQRQKKYLSNSQFESYTLIYVANDFFSNKSNNNNYHFKRDIKKFENQIMNFFIKSNMNALFYHHFSKMDLVTFDNYISNVIHPFVFNSIHHGQNSENDISNKLKNSEYQLIMYVQMMKQELSQLPDRGYFEIKYSDNGCGIDPKHLPYVFDKGFTTKKEKQGHGIGLWGVKQFVEKNGGTISLESTLGEGTTFQFTIPYEKIDNLYLRQRRV